MGSLALFFSHIILNILLFQGADLTFSQIFFYDFDDIFIYKIVTLFLGIVSLTHTVCCQQNLSTMLLFPKILNYSQLLILPDKLTQKIFLRFQNKLHLDFYLNMLSLYLIQEVLTFSNTWSFYQKYDTGFSMYSSLI